MDSLIRLRQMRQSELSGYFASLFPSFLMEYGSTAYYLNTNPSGYTTAENLTGYLAKNETGQFYSISNPSGYLTASDIDYSSYVTLTQTGLFYSSSNPSGYVTTGQTGNFATTGFVNTFSTGKFIQLRDPNYQGEDLTNILMYWNSSGYLEHSLVPGEGTFIVKHNGWNPIEFSVTEPCYFRTPDNGKYIYLNGSEMVGFILTDCNLNNTGNFLINSQTGNFVNTQFNQTVSGEKTFTSPILASNVNSTGAFSNLSLEGYNIILNGRGIQLNSTDQPFSLNIGADSSFTLLSDADINISTSDGTYGDIKVTSAKNLELNVTGLTTLNGYTVITSQDTGIFVAVSQTGNFITNTQTGQFYPRSGNPSNFISTSQTGNFVTTNQTGNFITSNQTGNFITNAQTGVFLTSSALTPYTLNSNTGNFITNSQTGIFVTTSQTGIFYPNTNPSGYINTASYNALDRKVYSFFLNPTESFIYTNVGAYLNKSDPPVGGGTAIKKAYNADTSPYISNSHDIALIPTGVTGYALNLNFFTTGIVSSANYFVWILQGLNDDSSQWYDIKSLNYNPYMTGAGSGNKIQRIYYTGLFSPTGKVSMNSRIAFQQTYPLDIYYLGGRCDFF